MDKTISRWIDPDGNGYAFKDAVARAQNQELKQTTSSLQTELKKKTANATSSTAGVVKGGSNVSIGSDGTLSVDAPKLCAYAYCSDVTATGTTNGSYTVLPAFTNITTYGDEVVRSDAYRLIVKKAGVYVFNVRLSVRSRTAMKRAEFTPYKNGARWGPYSGLYYSPVDATFRQLVTLPMKLAANDYIEFWAAPIEGIAVEFTVNDIMIFKM